MMKKITKHDVVKHTPLDPDEPDDAVFLRSAFGEGAAYVF
jgi:hypothetical protein